MLIAGQLLATDLAWCEGATDWTSLEELLETKKSENFSGELANKIRVNRNGQEIGPYSSIKAMEYFVSGQLFPTDLAWDEAKSEWRPLNEFLGLPLPAQASAAPTSKVKRPMNEETILMLSGGGILVVLIILGYFYPRVAQIIGYILLLVGVAIAGGGHLFIWKLAKEQTGPFGASLATLFPLSLFFIYSNWVETKKAVIAEIVGVGLIIIAILILGFSVPIQEDVVGTYEMSGFRYTKGLVFRKDGTVKRYTIKDNRQGKHIGGRKATSDTTWKLIDQEVHIGDFSKGNVSVYEIESNSHKGKGNLNLIGSIFNGERKDVGTGYNIYKKIK
jgi:hypothetical protein